MKRYALLALILALALTLAACGGAAAVDETTAPPSGGGVLSGDGDMTTLSPEQQAQMDAFREMLSKPADVQGVVTKVVGNEITLKLIEPLDTGVQIRRQDGEGPRDGAAPEGEGEFFFGVPGGEGSEGETRSFVMPTDENGNFVMPTDEDGNFVLPEGAEERMTQRGQGGGFSITDREVEVTYTGEETTVTIPAALTISSGMSSIQPSALTKDQVLSLWYGEDGEIANAMVTGTAKQD